MINDAQPIDATHDPAATSWVASANDPATDFPIQNLPFGQFREVGSKDWRIGVAIGDQILDLQKAGLVDHGDMNHLMRQTRAHRVEMRHLLHSGLALGSMQQTGWQRALVPMRLAESGLPCRVGDYTDFYVGIHHARAVGRMFRPDSPLLPNYSWVPIGYHGRASTILPSGVPFRRPTGQFKRTPDGSPEVGPTSRLDFELELGIVIGRPNPMGTCITIDEAEHHVFGLTLFNDWSARDIQAWEYQPLGPFLSKNFASTISPWIVTLEALAPFRCPPIRPANHPEPLPYLDCAANREHGGIDIDLQVLLQTRAMRETGIPAQTISTSNFVDAAFWSVSQLVAHHTVNGCGLNDGDLLGTGTLSGATREHAGSLLELAEGGKSPIVLANGETRSFVHDGDTVLFKGRCSREGFRSIGFGSCEARVEPAMP